jgi:hypothetical protein
MAKGKKIYKTFPLDEEAIKLLIKAQEKAKNEYAIESKLGTLKLALKKFLEDEK